MLPDGQIPYLLAAATHGQSVVIAERLVGAKSNELFGRRCRALAGGKCVLAGLVDVVGSWYG